MKKKEQSRKGRFVTDAIICLATLIFILEVLWISTFDFDFILGLFAIIGFITSIILIDTLLRKELEKEFK